MTALRLLLVALAVLAAGLRAEAATYYVATTGSEANDCTAAQTITTPKLRISSGVACATTAGDIVYIRAGTYTNALDVINSALYTVGTGSSGNPIVIAAYPSETVTLQPADGVAAVLLNQAADQYLSIQDLIIDYTNDTSLLEGIYVSGGAGNIQFLRNELVNASHFGVVFASGSIGSNEFSDGQVHGTGDPISGTSNTDGHAFYISSPDNTFRNNYLYNNEGYGFHLYDVADTENVARNVIRENVITSTGLTHTTAYAVLLAHGQDNLVFNNKIYNNNSGIWVYFQSDNEGIYNNTIVDNVNDGITLSEYTSAPTIRNNIVWANGDDINDFGGTGTPVISNNLITDPSFVNEAGRDYHLQAGSAAIDAGATIAAVTVDYYGTARPQNGTYDIGFHEFTAEAPAPPGVSLRLKGSRIKVGGP